jgi:predicted peptidase
MENSMSWQDEYLALNYESLSGERLAYRLLSPKPFDLSKQYPVVLFFHGAGERGSDNSSQLRHCLEQFAKPANQETFPCFVIAPQCPAEQQWVNMQILAYEGVEQRPAQPTANLRMAVEVLEQICNARNIDQNRVYVSGISMGGYATWDCLTRWPGKFAAAVPICGGGEGNTITSEIARIPVWTFHSADDPIVPVFRTREMVAAMQRANGNIRYTEYQDYGHNSWTPAYAEPELFPWLFSQQRRR